MRSTSFLLPFALFVAFPPSRGEAQVVIQGEVTVGTGGTNQTYQGNQSYQGGGYVDPSAYSTSTYVQAPVAQPQPIRYIHRSAPIVGLLVPGIVLLAGGYVAQAIGTPMIEGWDNSDQIGFAYIPILGPWLQLGAFDSIDRAIENGIAHFSWITGVAQALGLVLTIVGITVREEWDEPVYALTDDPLGPTLAFDGTRATLSF